MNIDVTKSIGNVEEHLIQDENAQIDIHIHSGVKSTLLIRFEEKVRKAKISIQIDEKAFGKSAEAVAETLRSGNPPIYVGEMKLMEGAVLIHPANLDAESADLIIARLNTLLNE